MNNHQPPKKPVPPPKPIEFTVVVSNWVEVSRRIVLETGSYVFSGTLAGAKASLVGGVFFSAKIYEIVRGCNELVATVRGTQTRQHPIS